MGKSKVSIWQKPFGYNDMYDLIFKTASSMDYLPLHFSIEGGTEDYVLWLWKGDYWGLQGGAEIGLYKSFADNEYVYDTSHYHVVDFELPMTLSLYEYKGSTAIENKFSWAPNEKQWWITGFDSSFTNPVPDNMGVVGSVDFSQLTQLYDDFKNAYFNCLQHHINMQKNQFFDGKKCLVFDDETHTVWIIWRETKSCQKNMY